MNTEKAVDLLDNLIGMVDDNQENDYDSALHMAINALKAQSDGDTISRQAAVDAMGKAEWAKERLRALPSAQPEKRTENTRKTHACDCISRQAAIDAIVAQTIGYTVDEIKAECEENIFNENGYLGGLKDAIEAIEDMQSAQPERCEDCENFSKTRLLIPQPEPCVDTIDALDESIKHFDDMAEECRRNANIEQNDYMDMRDDATEYRQLSIWLNELKWLRERFQSQPDLSEYSDKLWKAAYERGKAEAQQKWIPCSERLPAYGEDVLISIGGYCNVGYIVSVNEEEQYNWYFSGWYHLPNDVDAWMPLPEPYAERRTDDKSSM